MTTLIVVSALLAVGFAMANNTLGVCLFGLLAIVLAVFGSVING